MLIERRECQWNTGNTNLTLQILRCPREHAKYLANSTNDLLLPMHLFLHATVKCQSTALQLPGSKLLQEEYHSTWRRFISAIMQYADRETQVLILFQTYLNF